MTHLLISLNFTYFTWFQTLYKILWQQADNDRIGTATTAAMAGISEEKIQQLGRWKSSAFKKYIWIPTLNL